MVGGVAYSGKLTAGNTCFDRTMPGVVKVPLAIAVMPNIEQTLLERPPVTAGSAIG